MTIRHERVDFPPRGLLGGLAGTTGMDLVNDETIPAKGRSVLAKGDEVTFQTAGGGGLFAAGLRSREAIGQ